MHLALDFEEHCLGHLIINMVPKAALHTARKAVGWLKVFANEFRSETLQNKVRFGQVIIVTS